MFIDGELRSSCACELYFTKNFNFVAPLGKYLHTTEVVTETVTFQYIPIFPQHLSLFRDPPVRQQFMHPITCENGYQDFHDGLVFKQNCLFSRSDLALQIILYQDAFEISNPIGSPKKKRKLLAVYYTLHNFHYFNSSKIDSFQLSLLCKDKLVSEIIKPLIDNIKTLENEGVDFGFQKKVHGAVLCVMVDNFGSHLFGGFNASFSLSTFFCRYCMMR